MTLLRFSKFTKRSTFERMDLQYTFFNRQLSLSVRNWLRAMLVWLNNDNSLDRLAQTEKLDQLLSIAQSLPDTVQPQKQQIIDLASDIKHSLRENLKQAMIDPSVVPYHVRTGGDVNTIIEVWGHHIHEHRLQEIRESRAWSILIDESADVSK